ncbi:protein of unknown function [Cyanobium sp. NIES-981]|nr:protein of unknown function [Cyanobium sp. NIES-981]
MFYKRGHDFFKKEATSRSSQPKS